MALKVPFLTYAQVMEIWDHILRTSTTDLYIKANGGVVFFFLIAMPCKSESLAGAEGGGQWF